MVLEPNTPASPTAALSQEIKDLRTRCAEMCNIITNNTLTEMQGFTPENLDEKTLCYVDGVRADIESFESSVPSDSNLVTSQFLTELEQNMAQMEELIAYKSGLIKDIEGESLRLKQQIKMAAKATSMRQSEPSEVRPEHIARAKKDFAELKQQLQGLVHSLFPEVAQEMTGVLQRLMQEKLSPETGGYLDMDPAKYPVVVVLMDMGLVVTNPYNNKEIRLAYFLITYINVTSVKLFVKVQNVFGTVKVLACLLVIGGGVYSIATGSTEYLQKGFEGSTTSPGSIALALYSGLWAYDGWNSVTVVTEEIINPAVNVPLSISLAVPLMTALYVFMNTAYMSVLSYEEMVSVPAVAVAFGAKVLGPASFLIPLGVAISTFGCALSVQFGVARVCYSAAKGGHMMEVFSFVHMTRMTPAPAVVLQACLTTIFIIVGNIKTLIEFASWFLWFFYGLAMVALLVLRKTQPDRPRPYRVPTPVPWFVLLVAIFLSVLPIVKDPSLKYVMAVGSILIGLVVYTLFVFMKKTPAQLIDKFTCLAQKLFLSVPPSNKED